jgi:hypothetical protein
LSKLLEIATLRAMALRSWKWARRRTIRLWRRLFPPPPAPPPPNETEQALARIFALAASAPKPPLLARIALVVPVFDTNPTYLDDLLASLRAQRAGAWELVLSDDGSREPRPAPGWTRTPATPI